MTTTARVFLLLLACSFASELLAQQRLCSGGPNDGRPCARVEDCPSGSCVVAQGVCDGGPDDGFDCDCPGSQCSSVGSCTNDPELGTCEGGPYQGECCDPAYNCGSAAPCRGTQKICLGGELKGLSCLRNEHCPGSLCWATGRVCSGDGFACVDDSDCILGTCQGEGTFPTPTPTQPPTGCIGDCDGDGEVTINNVLLMVNIALEQAPIAQCAAGDANQDGIITVDELIAAVGLALAGCAP